MSRYSKLLDEVSAIPDADGVIRPLIGRRSTGKKVVKARASKTLAKSLSVQELLAKAGIDAKVKPFTGKKPATLPDVDGASTPATLRHEALKHAIVQHAVANENPNSPISEAMLNRVLKMAKAGHLTNDQARRTVEYHSKGLALPTDVMHAIGGN
jgi:hypothetical protein